MGIEMFGESHADWVALCRQAVKADKIRQETVRTRIRLYFDDYQEILQDYIRISTQDPDVVNQLVLYIPLVGGQNLIKRVSNELGRPLYARDALRRVQVEQVEQPGVTQDEWEIRPATPEQAAWEGLATEMEINRVMDQVARLLTPSTRVFLKPRVVDGVMALDLFTADMMTVIPHRKRPTKGAVYIHACSMLNGKPNSYVAIDDKRSFQFTMEGDPVLIEPADHDWGVAPIVDISLMGRPGCYWNTTDGDDLKAQTLASMAVQLVIEAKAFQQSHIQLAFKGDVDAMPKGQTLHNKSVLFLGGGPDSQLVTLDLQSDPAGLLKIQEQGENTVAGNYGISRERLNQKGGAAVDDGLQERVAERAQILYGGEQQLFSIVKQVSREHPKYKLPENATIIVDLGYLHNRTDRKTQMDLREMEIKQGLRSGVDSVLEDNPEYGGNRMLALGHIKERVLEQAEIYDIQRSVNAPNNGDVTQAGQTAKENGLLGPLKRDGHITADMASAISKGDAPKDLRVIALRVLKGGKSA